MKIKFNEQEEELVGGPNSPERRESRARQNFRNKATQWTNEVLYILKRMHRLTDRTNYAAAEGELQQVITAIRDEVERLQATFDNALQMDSFTDKKSQPKQSNQTSCTLRSLSN